MARQITIGDRTFDVRSPLPLGTFRRVPGAMDTLFEFKDLSAKGAFDPRFLTAKLDTILRIIHDDVNADRYAKKEPLIISFEDFAALLDNQDAFVSLDQVAKAIVEIFADTKDVAASGESSGNGSGSESQT